jgi:hypothetical protein
VYSMCREWGIRLFQIFLLYYPIIRCLTVGNCPSNE